MKEQIKELRVKIDGLAQLVKTLDFSHREVDLMLKKPDESLEQFYDRCHAENLGKQIIRTSHERNNSYDNLILAKAWLGKVLGELGESTPYANDGNRKTVEDIEPAADKNTMIEVNTNKSVFEEHGWKNKSRIEKVDWLRQEIQHITHLVEQTIFTSNQSREFAIARTNSYNHLCEARFWLGFELQRIKEGN